VIVKIMETDPERLKSLATDWGIKFVAGCHPAVLQVAIADAYSREINLEARRAGLIKAERNNG
jgi:hypothetical protein